MCDSSYTDHFPGTTFDYLPDKTGGGKACLQLNPKEADGLLEVNSSTFHENYVLVSLTASCVWEMRMGCVFVAEVTRYLFATIGDVLQCVVDV